MRTIDDHRAEITALLAPLRGSLGSEWLPVSGESLSADPARYLRRVLARDLVSPSSLPAFDNSQMDGFAVRAADLATATAHSPVSLPVAPRVAAGDVFGSHAAGTATPIMTGAGLPEGADAVVQIEKAVPPVFPTASGDTHVSFVEPVAAGTFVRSAGSDVREGEVLLAAGAVLGPAQFGVVAGTGAVRVEVRRRIRVLLVSTGHEIRDAGTALAPGQIFDANTVSLTAALLGAGCEVVARPCRSDDADDLLDVIRDEPDVDLVVTVGGVSAGAREVVRDALGPLGVKFMKVAMQPGGPQGFGRIEVAVEGAAAALPVVCLPGNPVSALVSFEAFLRPALLRTLGAEPLRETRRAPSAEAFASPPNHHQLRRGVLEPDGRLRLRGGPSSHLLHSYAESTVLVHVPVGTTRVAEGDELDFWRIDG
ncbi:molybdopterin molybdotransferase MoeA [Herbiconiux sp. CPCC 203407]|uniref:Molybdopterin molybdenumtransferase n=1 Tax=Herbiconiux oxytropis TaxID=2970915 RepID=A0AA41XG57_9MICO|nr:gephyrin-like molybdotransferase Glp [Herbiconiux oxytropis]MCS5722480.1 molybdopterin molybdotransferase MoeA [Herbiconiux oxytropis]MCS5727587.1 molybdopterin molybdotransferase MoeA [Herbiconiux oxytropis]